MIDPLLLYSTKEYREIHKFPTIPFPKMLVMQASSFCNFTCLQCPRQTKVARRYVTKLGQGYLEPTLVTKLADEFKIEPSFIGVLFALYGEPLMNKNIVEFVRIIKEAGKRVQITTNGFFLDDNMICQLLGAGLDKIKISFQGTTKNEYAFWRNNPYYDKIVGNVLKLINEREKSGRNIFIQVGTSIANDTDDEVHAFMEFWSNKVDHVYYDFTGMLHIQDFEYIKGKTFKHQAVRRTEPCFDIFTRMSVLYNGTVPLCVDDEEHERGNLYKNSIKEIWLSENFEKDRQMILKEGNVLPQCKYCYTSPRKPI